MMGRMGAQHVEIAAAPGPESEIIADQQVAGLQAFLEHTGNEVLGRHGRQRGVEVGDAESGLTGDGGGRAPTQESAQSEGGNLAKTGNTLIVPSNLADVASLVTSVTTMFKAQPK